MANILLLIVYALYILFSLRTHTAAFASVDSGHHAHHDGGGGQATVESQVAGLGSVV